MAKDDSITTEEESRRFWCAWWQRRGLKHPRCLVYRIGLRTPAEVARVHELELLCFKGVGPASIKVIKRVLARAGLSLVPNIADRIRQRKAAAARFNKG